MKQRILNILIAIDQPAWFFKIKQAACAAWTPTACSHG
jgi:hypothetical protein